MRMLKALVAASTGILLLALPAVAMPQAPRPGAQECTATSEEEAAEERAERELGAEEPEDECVRKAQPNAPGAGSAVDQLADALLGSNDGSAIPGT